MNKLLYLNLSNYYYNSISIKINLSNLNRNNCIYLGHSQQDMWRIRKAISEATSLEEVEHLTKLLQAGQIPNKDQKKKSGLQNGGK